MHNLDLEFQGIDSESSQKMAVVLRVRDILCEFYIDFYWYLRAFLSDQDSRFKGISLSWFLERRLPLEILLKSHVRFLKKKLTHLPNCPGMWILSIWTRTMPKSLYSAAVLSTVCLSAGNYPFRQFHWLVWSQLFFWNNGNKASRHWYDPRLSSPAI